MSVWCTFVTFAFNRYNFLLQLLAHFATLPVSLPYCPEMST